MDLYAYAGMFRANTPASYRRAAVAVARKAPRGTTRFPDPPVYVAPKAPRGWVGFPDAGPIVGLEGYEVLGLPPWVLIAGGVGLFLFLRRRK